MDLAYLPTIGPVFLRSSREMDFEKTEPTKLITNSIYASQSLLQIWLTSAILKTIKMAALIQSWLNSIF